MPGLRLGFGVCMPALATKLDAHKDVWNVNLLAQAAGVAALKDHDYQEKSRAFLAETAPKFAKAVAALPNVATVLPPSANFLMLRLKEAGQAEGLIRGLRSRGILIRDCANFPGLSEGWLRLAVRKEEENERLLDAWREIVC